MSNGPITSIPVLDALPGVAAHFIGRIPEIDVMLDREAAMERLRPHQQQLLEKAGLGSYPLVTAKQIHGNGIVLVESPDLHPIHPFAGADGLVTTRRGITLGIYVADCAPLWVVARDGSGGALLHSGKKGTELNILHEGVKALSALGGYAPSELVVVIGPCIRLPCYEIDFATAIGEQARAEGIHEIHDDLICTACDTEHYYSYRREKGLTGRMLATLTLLPT